MFIHSSDNGHLGSFHLLATVNSAAMNMHTVHVLVEYLFSILLGIYLGVELLGHKVILRLTF